MLTFCLKLGLVGNQTMFQVYQDNTELCRVKTSLTIAGGGCGDGYLVSPQQYHHGVRDGYNAGWS